MPSTSSGVSVERHPEFPYGAAAKRTVAALRCLGTWAACAIDHQREGYLRNVASAIDRLDRGPEPAGHLVRVGCAQQCAIASHLARAGHIRWKLEVAAEQAASVGPLAQPQAIKIGNRHGSVAIHLRVAVRVVAGRHDAVVAEAAAVVGTARERAPGESDCGASVARPADGVEARDVVRQLQQVG